MKRPILSLAAFWAIAWSGAALRAAIIYETASLGPSDFGGVTVYDRQFLGVRFQLDNTVITESIGGHFTATVFGNGRIFGALVRLDDLSDFPDSTDLSTPDVLGTTLLSPPQFPTPSGDTAGDLHLTLPPGAYAMVFGSGLFGATATAAAPGQDINVAVPLYIVSSGLEAGSFYQDASQGNARIRMFVNGIAAPTIPEPASLAIWSVLALAGVGFAGWRRRR